MMTDQEPDDNRLGIFGILSLVLGVILLIYIIIRIILVGP
jgi:hypothetical protein